MSENEKVNTPVTTDDPRVHGYYWRTPGIPVLVYESKRRPGVFMFTGGGLHGPAKHPMLPEVKYFGPIVAPAFILAVPEECKETPVEKSAQELLEEFAEAVGVAVTLTAEEVLDKVRNLRKLLEDIAQTGQKSRALRNVQALGMKLMKKPESMKAEEVAKALIRFAEEGGIKSPSVLRVTEEEEARS